MTDPRLAYAETARGMEVVRVQLVDTLSASSHEEVRALAPQVLAPSDHEAISIVFVGQHDAGKSSLLSCLTGRDDIPIGVGPTTSRTSRYRWSGHVLIDTPGVLAGVDASHDALAWEALETSDVIVFVTTVEGLDDATADYFQQVHSHLRSVSPLVVAVNKMNTERSDRAVVAEDILEALGPMAEGLPVAWTDARMWLEAESAADPDRMRRESSVQDLADIISERAQERGVGLRQLSTLRSWSQLLTNGLRIVSGAHTEAEEHSLQGLDELLVEIDNDARETVRLIEVRSDGAVARLRAQLVKAGHEVAKGDLEALVADAFTAFEAELAEDALQQEGELLRRAAHLQAGAENGEQVARVDCVNILKKALLSASKTFSGTGARPGGAGHRIVQGVGRLANRRFGPWGIVNTSRTIGTVARRATVAITVGQVAWGVLQVRQEGRASESAAQASARWPAEAHALAEEIVLPWREAAIQEEKVRFESRWSEIARQRSALLFDLADEDADAARFLEIEGQLSQLITVLDKPV